MSAAICRAVADYSEIEVEIEVEIVPQVERIVPEGAGAGSRHLSQAFVIGRRFSLIIR